MTPEATKRLKDRFGYMLRSDKHPNYALEKYGFECDDGWFQLLWDLLENIENYLRTASLNEINGFSVLQVKEKYGTLRFYYSWNVVSENILRQLVTDAENKSATTCERCGAPGIVRGFHRIQCTCWDCFVNLAIDDIEYTCAGAPTIDKDNISPVSGKIYGKTKVFADPKTREFLRNQLTNRFGPRDED